MHALLRFVDPLIARDSLPATEAWRTEVTYTRYYTGARDLGQLLARFVQLLAWTVLYDTSPSRDDAEEAQRGQDWWEGS